MGACFTSRGLNQADSNANSAFTYYSKVVLQITGFSSGIENVSMYLKRPVYESAETLPLLGAALQISACVLPGQDPRETYNKVCQDCLGTRQVDSMTLVVLCDGHGKQGHLVAEFSVKFMLEFFSRESQSFKTNPSSALTQMIEECDSTLRKNAKIDCALSGCTAVAGLLIDGSLYVANVGDSRAILARVPRDDDELPQVPYVNLRHRLVPCRMLMPLQLSVDQKPNSDEEIQRIKQAGGIVKRLVDEMGNSIGPYRVWKTNSRYPGLAMSRSIGDFIAAEVGVISTPVIKQYSVSFNSDQFFILASDGVWDVMENIEVVNFVERFRKFSMKVPSTARNPVTPTNSSISHLLCEEARMRWLNLVQEKDVVIDDISCVIVELSSNEALAGKNLA